MEKFLPPGVSLPSPPPQPLVAPPKPTSSQTRRLVGASILPYAVDDMWGNVYWLLGKEQVVRGWANGSEKWSDFGGASKAGESAAQTAAREFHEETLAMMPFYEGEEMPRQSYVPIVKALQAGEYTFKMETPIGEDGVYITFVVQVPLLPGITAEVEKTHALLSKLAEEEGGRGGVASGGGAAAPIDHPACSANRVNRDYLEKTTCRFWSTPVLKRAGTSFSGTIQNRTRSGLRNEQLRNTFRHRLRIVLAEFPTDRFTAFSKPRISYDTYETATSTAIETRDWVSVTSLPSLILRPDSLQAPVPPQPTLKPTRFAPWHKPSPISTPVGIPTS